jgi:hypothetical protein
MALTNWRCLSRIERKSIRLRAASSLAEGRAAYDLSEAYEHSLAAS